jgi:DNA invertase Pin-like site-specific DNA recombinase
VLVSKLDRLGRSLLVIVDAHDRLGAAGVALRSGREPIDTSTPSGRLIFQMLASFAEYDRENIAERTQAGLRRAFRKGRQLGVIPFGYDVAEPEGASSSWRRRPGSCGRSSSTSPAAPRSTRRRSA